MNLNGKTVLVTGACGFIGSHLVEHLVTQTGAGKVKALVMYNARTDWGNVEFLPDEIKNAIEVIPGDITDPFFMRNITQGVDVVFHLAALVGIPYSYIAPQHYVQTNVQGTLNVLEACRSEGVQKLVHTSTSETYGTARYTPIDEKHPMQGQSPYSASKIAADKLAESYHLSFELPVATIRPFNTFGPRQSARAIIPSIISQALTYEKSKQPIKVGSLTPVRDFTYAKDTARGFVRVAECDDAIGEVINVGSGKAQSIQETLDLILEILGKDIPVETDESRVRPEKSEVLLLLANADKAKQILNWQPEYSFRQGLEETVASIRQSLDRYKTAIYNV